MAVQRYRVERLSGHHNRTAFSSGEASLDAYLKQRAQQDTDRNVATVFVLADFQDNQIAGYYTLSSSAVQLENLPPEVQRNLPRYPFVPVILLGRLAIAQAYQGHGFGEVLLFNALRRACNVGTREIAATAVIVDALHSHARAFYERYGFLRFADNEYRLFLTMQTIGQILEEGDA